MFDDRRLEKLEQTIVELGAETHRLRNEVELYMESNMNMAKKLYIIQRVLDERGVLLIEDFEIAQELYEEKDEFKKRAMNLKKVMQ